MRQQRIIQALARMRQTGDSLLFAPLRQKIFPFVAFGLSTVLFGAWLVTASTNQYTNADTEVEVSAGEITSDKPERTFELQKLGVPEDMAKQPSNNTNGNASSSSTTTSSSVVTNNAETQVTVNGETTIVPPDQSYEKIYTTVDSNGVTNVEISVESSGGSDATAQPTSDDRKSDRTRVNVHTERRSTFNTND